MRKYLLVGALSAGLLFTPGCSLRGRSGVIYQTILAAFTSDLEAVLNKATIAITQEFVKLQNAPITVVVRDRETHAIVFQQEFNVVEAVGTFSEVIPFVAEFGKNYDLSILMQDIQTPWKPL